MEQTVSFASEGYRLAANLHLPSEGAPCVVMSHGLESSKDGDKWPELARQLSQVGIGALRFSHRGCGWGPDGSEGTFEDTTLTARIADFRAALDFLQGMNIDHQHIGAVGSSFGGMVVLGAEDPRVGVLALLATPSAINWPGIPEGLPEEERLPQRSRLKARFLYNLAKYDLPAAISRYGRPVLVAHGDQDEVVPVEHAHRLYQAAGEPKHLEVIAGANHTFDVPAHRQRVLSLCVEWLQQHLHQE